MIVTGEGGEGAAVLSCCRTAVRAVCVNICGYCM